MSDELKIELEIGNSHALALVMHLERMGSASKGEIPLTYKGKAFMVTIESCDKSCGFVEPYGWVPEHGCHIHDK